MTIHKAQGSEFERVEVVLPARDSRVLTRELLYTALTRARTSVRLWARAAVLRDTIAEYTEGAVGSLGGARRVRPVLSAQEIDAPAVRAPNLTEIAPQHLQGAQGRDRRGLGAG